MKKLGYGFQSMITNFDQFNCCRSVIFGAFLEFSKRGLIQLFHQSYSTSVTERVRPCGPGIQMRPTHELHLDERRLLGQPAVHSPLDGFLIRSLR